MVKRKDQSIKNENGIEENLEQDYSNNKSQNHEILTEEKFLHTLLTTANNMSILLATFFQEVESDGPVHRNSVSSVSTSRTKSSTRTKTEEESYDSPIVVITPKNFAKFKDEKLEDSYFAINISSFGDYPWKKFHPAWPHGGIKVPNGIKGLSGSVSSSVQGIFNALSIFEKRPASPALMLQNEFKMISKKPTSTKFGPLKGFCKDLNDLTGEKSIMNTKEFRLKFLFPAYKYVLENNLGDEIDLIKKEIKEGKQIVIVDPDKNRNIDQNEDFSFGYLLQLFLEGNFPKGKTRTIKEKEVDEDEEEEETTLQKKRKEPSKNSKKGKKKKEEEEEKENEEIGDEEEEEENEIIINHPKPKKMKFKPQKDKESKGKKKKPKKNTKFSQ